MILSSHLLWSFKDVNGQYHVVSSTQTMFFVYFTPVRIFSSLKTLLNFITKEKLKFEKYAIRRMPLPLKKALLYFSKFSMAFKSIKEHFHFFR